MSYSQETYPKLTVFEKDTCVVLLLSQATSINIVFEENRALKEKLSVLDSIIVQKDILSSKMSSVIAKKDESIKYISEQYILCSDQNKKLIKQRRWLVCGSIVLGIITAIII